MREQADNIYVESLTERELEVLRLLAEGLSNKEIAEAMVVEVSTVKWYNNQIYGKLQVKNRAQAVIRARTLGILEADAADPLLRPQHNLPADTLPFIGREQEIGELVQQLTDDGVRLITILGPGGMGKSRLSIEVGRRLLGHFQDGVYFVSLAAVTSAEQMVTTVAETIGFKFHSDAEPKQQLLDYLQKRHLLLITDNFEHLLEHSQLLNDILRTAANIKVLATSREKLNLAGEVLHILQGLTVSSADSAAPLTDSDAVRLFTEVAQRAANPVTDDDMVIVGRICQLLGGMPLGILLAAAWVDTLSIAEIAAEIENGLGILEAPLRDILARHQNIEAIFSHSWQRLDTQEQAVFMRLSVFCDGFTREAAQAVTGVSIRDLQRLVHTSFVQHQPSGRYTMHELMRQYGAAKLIASGKLKTIREQHAEYFATFIAPLSAAPYNDGSVTPAMLMSVHNDFENLRAAWQFQAEHKNIAELRRFLDGLWHYIDSYSRSQEGIGLFEPLLLAFRNGSDDERLFRGQVMARLAWFVSDTGQHNRALELVDQALEIVEGFDATDDILFIYQLKYYVLRFMNKYKRSIEYAENGLKLAQRRHASRWLVAFSFNVGQSNTYLGNYDEAWRQIEPLPASPTRTLILGELLRKMGELAQAEAVMLEALSTQYTHRVGTIFFHRNLATCAFQAGDYDKAWHYIRRGLQYCDDGSYAWGTVEILGPALQLLIAEQAYAPATELLALMLHHPSSPERVRTEVAAYRNTLQNNLNTDDFEAAWERGKGLDLGDLITEYMER